MIERVRINPAKRDNTVEHKGIPCVFCDKLYLSPCDSKGRASACQNYLFKTGAIKPAERAQPRTERVRIERVKLKPKAKGKKR